MNYFSRLKNRELTGKIPNSNWDYHLQPFRYQTRRDPVSALVIADDILFVAFVGSNRSYIIPFGLHEISPLRGKNGRSIRLSYEMEVEYICFNSNNNSLIIVLEDEGENPDHNLIVHGHEGEAVNPYRKIQSIPIESIKSITEGKPIIYTELFAKDTRIVSCDFDIPNCRGIIRNLPDNEYKVFELDKYRTLFTIPIESGYRDAVYHTFLSRGRTDLNRGILLNRAYRDTDMGAFLCPGHRDMVMCNYGRIDRMDKITLKIYSKHHQSLRWQTEIHLRSGHLIEFIALCGSDRILLQQVGLGIEVFDASTETPQLIKSTELKAVRTPYYLEKHDTFLVETNDRKVHVCDRQGSIKVTFDEYQMCLNHEFKYCLMRTDRIPGGIFISGEQHYAISVCLSNENGGDYFMIDDDNTGLHDDEADNVDHRTINVSNLVTGELLAKIRPNASNGSELRKRVMRSPITALTYNENTRDILTGSKSGRCCLWSLKLPSDMSE